MLWSSVQRSKPTRYALAIVATVAAAFLHWLIAPVTGARIPFLFFLPTILLVATSLGRGPALLVLCGGLVNGVLLISEPGFAASTSWPDVTAALAYLVVGLMLAEYGGRLRLITRQKDDTEQRLALVQTSTGVGLFEVDLDRNTVLGSKTFWELLATKPRSRSVPAESWTSRLHPDDVVRGAEIFVRKTAEGARSYEREDRVTLPTGDTRWVLSRMAVDRDQQGRAARLRGAMVDITERKKTQALLGATQKELVQQIQDLQKLHELSVRLVQLDDVEAQLQLILQSLAEFHGAHKGLISLYDAPADRVHVRAQLGFGDGSLARLLDVRGGDGACGRVCQLKQRVIIEDTASDPYFTQWRMLAVAEGFKAVHSSPLLSQSGDILGAISIHLQDARAPTEREIRLADICARKVTVILERNNALVAARESSHRLQVALESAAVPFSILTPVRDGSGRIVDLRWNYLNPAAVTALDHPEVDVLGKRVQDVLPTIWEQPDLLEHFVAVIERNDVSEFELRYRRADGMDGWYHVVASPMEGAVAAWFADMSERKHQEQLLREADRRKDEFLATLSHELRNPLAPIRQAAIISKSPAATAEQKLWSHDVIERQVQHMALLLDDLLDVSRITRGRLELRKQRTDLRAVVNAAVETARPLIDAKRHALSMELPESAVEFDADPLRVAQVIANLLTNAAKYTNSAGNIRLRGFVDKGDVVIAVRDDGIGLRAEELPAIFQMFGQVNPSRERSEGGLGIGLSLAKGLVELHGGRIEVHSEGPNLGSEFTVRFPRGAATRPTLRAPANDATLVTTARRVLVADDNRDSAGSLAMLLSMDGHVVRLAHDGEEALAAFDDFKPDIALLDIGMPKRTGYEVAERIRRDENGKHVTLVAVTGWGQENDKNRALEAGFDYHITKPLDPRQLNQLLSIPTAAACQ